MNRDRGSTLQARELRRAATSAERVLWELLRGRRLLGLKFRRQFPIDRYVADFCCPELRLIVELDGEIHLDEAQIAHDRNRDGYLRSLDYRVLRFPNKQVLHNPASVLDQIETAIRTFYPWLNL